MNVKSFLKELKSKFESVTPNTEVGGYIFKGINNTDGFGSPGGNWSPAQFPAFDLEKANKHYLIRIIPKENKIVIEAIHLSTMLINYRLDDKNFIQSKDKIKLLEDYWMTVNHRRKISEVKRAMDEVGMRDNIIFEENSINLNLDNIVASLLKWADYRALAKEKLRGKGSEKSVIKPESGDFKDNIHHPLNQILYGPPGTGKTYNTINKAVAIIDGIKEESLNENYQNRSDLKERFDELLIDDWDNPVGQIGFITFHQSMSYEDFIEGIKPITTTDQKVIYDTLPGIFKSLCIIARDNWLDTNRGSQENLSFEEAFSMLKDNWEEDPAMKFPLKTKGRDYTIIGFTKSSIKFKKSNGGTGHTLSISTLGDFYYNKKEVRQTGVGIYYPPLLEKLKSFQPSSKLKKTIKKYALIIDEINRGNVSQIFGELITLIEEDKRLGKEESLEASLPYSKEIFGVPPNLFIIGTMNTADRSVEGLDTALRRRFVFEEMIPKPELLRPQRLVWDLLWKYEKLGWEDEPYKSKEIDLFELLGVSDEDDFIVTTWEKIRKEKMKLEDQISYFDELGLSGINLELMLKAINSRLNVLLSKDHTIGHAWLMNVYSLHDLQLAFKNKILPLLQEYFYINYAKIGLILGDKFVKQDIVKGIFAKFKDEQEIAGDYEGNILYSLIDPMILTIEDFKSIYQ